MIYLPHRRSAFRSSGYDYWNVNDGTVSYEKKQPVAGEQRSTFNIYIRDDGIKMYTIGSFAPDDDLTEYTLSTPWDVTSASKVASTDLAEDSFFYGIWFKTDGTKMYGAGNSSDKIHEYDLGTAWDITTLSYNNKFLNVTTQDTGPLSINMKSDGTKFYYYGLEHETIYQYTINTPWDITSSVYDNKFYDVSADLGGNIARNIFTHPDGFQIFVMDKDAEKLFDYRMTTAWDISTLQFSGTRYATVNTEGDNPWGLFFKPDGTKMYVSDYIDDNIWQYAVTP